MEALLARSPAALSAGFPTALVPFGGFGKVRSFFVQSSHQQSLSGCWLAQPLTNSFVTGAPVQSSKAPVRGKAQAAAGRQNACRMEAHAPLRTPGGEVADCELAHPLLRRTLRSMLQPYLKHNPTAERVMALIQNRESGDIIRFDHFAFRTFGVPGYGIDSMAQLFLDLGYHQRDELLFPAKKLRAHWYSPPKEAGKDERAVGTEGPLPRIFISELLVDQLSDKAQAIIHKYTSESRHLAAHAALSGLVHGLPWRTPELKDYVELTRETEYGAWTLVNGYALNHTTVTCHELINSSSLRDTIQYLTGRGIPMNGHSGHLINVSPDGLLLQASTEADVETFNFAGGQEAKVPRSYIELAFREVLPQFEHLPLEEVYECHRRDGFEVGNADNIFESTNIKHKQ